MTEFTTEVTTLKVSRKCIVENCNGEMKYIKEKPVLLSNPPQFWHECSVCRKITYCETIYPYIKYEDSSHAIKNI